ncbi:bacteriorhodopsin [Halorientalis sp. IM1011]|uniref:bacteriorhodopsin n=1 Tax=Halorientalis sp. IM1011 TaxID=1932360 RepID=UPI0009821E64|nr:bacteriorhodopsin [Halorientalis sp. IM1011]
MISPTTVYAVTGVLYTVVFAALFLWLRRIPEQYRRLCQLVLAVIAVSAVGMFLDAARVGILVVNGTELTIPTVVSDLVAYSVLWGIAALLAGVSRKLLAVAVGIPLLQRLSFSVATVSGGVVALLALGILIGGHIFLIYFYRNRIWAVAQSLPDKQRLLHWKSRNLLLFLVGMIIVFSVLALFGLFDTFVSNVLTQYMNLLIRAGFAGFLFANVTNVDIGDAADGLVDELTGDTGGDPTDPEPAD